MKNLLEELQTVIAIGYVSQKRSVKKIGMELAYMIKNLFGIGAKHDLQPVLR